MIIKSRGVFRSFLFSLFGIILVLKPGVGWAQIKIVGSSTVFPFSTTVAERFGKSTKFNTPVVEATGTGGGIKLFCSGLGASTPDIANASSRMTPSQLEGCIKNGVGEVVEIKFGFDGIVMAQSRANKQVELKMRHLYLALASQIPTEAGVTRNPYKSWNEIEASLPAQKIKVLGPPPTSGTRIAFAELAMDKGARSFKKLAELRKTDKQAFKRLAYKIREDGAYVEAGENDNLIVQKISRNPSSFGIFGYSFLAQNQDKIRSIPIDGVTPSFENIASGKYPISRSLFFYVKKAHIGKTPGLAEFVGEFTRDSTWGEDGYLADKGLIPLSPEEAVANRKRGAEMIALKPGDLK